MHISRFLSGLLLSVGLLSSACYRINYLNGGAIDTALPVKSQWHHVVLFGLYEYSQPIALDTICPQGFSRVRHRISAANGAVPYAINIIGSAIQPGLALGGLYTPHTVEVWCKSGTAYSVQTNEEGYAVAVSPMLLTRNPDFGQTLSNGMEIEYDLPAQAAP